MNIDILKGKQFEKAVNAYLSMAFWCQSLTVENDTKVEHLDDVYYHEDLDESALAFIQGQVLAIYVKLSQMGFDDIRDDAIEAIMRGLAGAATGSGVSLDDNGAIFPLQEEDMEALDAWHREQWGVRTLNMYPGDDGKVYIEGFEHLKPFTVEVSLAERKGKNGVMFRHECEAYSWSAATLKMLKGRLSGSLDISRNYSWVKLIRQA